MPKVDINELRDRLEYNRETGDFKWRTSSLKYFKDKRAQKIWNTRYAGQTACHYRRDGRIVISIRGEKILAHRVAMALSYGEWPSGEVDHINGDTQDNRLCNLRATTKSGNMRNQKRRYDNKSGVTGVQQRDNKWYAYITSGGKVRGLGFYRCLTAATLARKAAERRYGYHPNHGRAA